MPEEYILKLPAILILTFMLFSLIVLMLLNTGSDSYAQETENIIPAPEEGDDQYVGFSDFKLVSVSATKRKRLRKEMRRYLYYGNR